MEVTYFLSLVQFQHSSLQLMQNQARYKPVNTFTRRPCLNQIISYLIIAFENISFWALVQNNYISQSSRYIMIALFSVSTFQLVLVALMASSSDPSDPIMVQYKNGNTSAIGSKGNPCLFCQHCESYVLVSSRHCKVCDRCVQRFDHHCIWINNCIGRSNYCLFMVMIVSVLANMVLYLVSVALLWSENQWKLFLPMMVINWFLSLFITILAFLILGLIILHLFLIHQGLTTFDYIMNKRNAQISPLPVVTNTQLSQANQRDYAMQRVEEMKREGSEYQSHQSQPNYRTQNQMAGPPLSAFQNMQNQQRSSDFQSFDHIKSTHNKLPLEKRTQKLMIQKAEMNQDIEAENFNNFYKKHRGLKLLVGPAIMVKPKRSQSSKLIRNSSLKSIKSNASKYTESLHIQQMVMQSEIPDNVTIKSQEKE